MTTTGGVPTPGSRQPRPTVVVLGAGIAGLTAAHELVGRGFAVTVYEPRADERSAFAAGSDGHVPPVKLGGLAASQFVSPTPVGGGTGHRLRAFPGRRGTPRLPERPIAGEHGFRFFPAYYLHIWDMLQRIPLYERVTEPGDEGAWRPTARTVMDNVRRVTTQATTTDGGKGSLIFPREAPTNLAEMMSVTKQLVDLGYTPADVATFSGRLMQYMVTSPQRRRADLQNQSAFDYFVGRRPDGSATYSYSTRFEALILDMPKVLAAFDSRWGDARTNINTYLQLQFQMDRRDSKADGVLNGPTTGAWFDHWYHHLDALGVRFERGTVDRIEPITDDRSQPAYARPRVRVVLDDGTVLQPDYVVVAADAPTAERITWPLRAAGTGGTVAGLDRFTTSLAPPGSPLQPGENRPAGRRDPFALDEMGRQPWDRFQTLAGIQFYFDTEFQLVRGHIYYSGTSWGLSSIGQHGLWERRPTLDRDGFVSVLSVDIGDFNTPCPLVIDEGGRAKAARDCSPDEIAAGVWHQIVAALTTAGNLDPATTMPTPAWYLLDRNLTLSVLADGSEGPAVRNGAPYLVPIVGDWDNRPGADPWNPQGSSSTPRSTDAAWHEDVELRNVWQAGHGGYQVHHNGVVFAGTWTKTFTRMTSMEAACESGRHAVNAILDHYIWTESAGADRRDERTIEWHVPFGFLDQGYSSPVRLPSPAGDYCFVFDVEDWEPFEAREMRDHDAAKFEAAECPAGRSNPCDPATLLVGAAPGPPVTSSQGASMTDYAAQLLGHLQAWRHYLEQLAPTGPMPTMPTMPPTGPPMPTMRPTGPTMPRMPPTGPTMPTMAMPASPARSDPEPSSSVAPPTGGRVDRSLYSVAMSSSPTGRVPEPRRPSAFRWLDDVDRSP